MNKEIQFFYSSHGIEDMYLIPMKAGKGCFMLAIIDSGASDIVLRPDDADRAGIDVSGVPYNLRRGTANGDIEDMNGIAGEFSGR